MTSETTTAKQPWFCPPDLSGSRIGSLMGHPDIHTTTRYVRATERNKQEAVEAAMLGSIKLSTNWPSHRRPPGGSVNKMNCESGQTPIRVTFTYDEGVEP